jgi:hypothetical protein
MTRRVQEMLREIKRLSHTLKEKTTDTSENDTLHSVLIDYRNTLETLECLGAWVDHHNDGQDIPLEGISVRASDQLITVATRFCQEQQATMKVPLKKLGYSIEDSALLASITGSSSRLELASSLAVPTFSRAK